MTYRQEIENRLRELSHLEHILALLSWDQETYMPPAGAVARSEEMSMLVGLWHERVCDPWWDEALDVAMSTEDNESQKRMLAVFKRDRDKEVKIPTLLAVAMAKAVSEAFQAWHTARQQSDFQIFLPALQKIFDLSIEKATALGYEKNHAYNAFLDIHEENLTEEQFDPMAQRTRRIMQSVLAAIQGVESRTNRDIFSHKYPVEDQKKLCGWLLPRLGFSLDRGRLDVSPHPFSTTIAQSDVRLTTRYDEHNPLASLYGVLHEAGHGLYEQGFLSQWEHTPLAQAISLGIHESQSRFWENQIGRSREFIEWVLPALQEAFPEALENITGAELFQAVNKVSPSLIRVESDEVTYGLHILVRYEIEKNLFRGDIRLTDAPVAWNGLYKEYLGVVPRNDAEGILQDIHWSHGSFGYFPTYLLGNLYASQWYDAMRHSLDVNSLVRQGEFEPILTWLRHNIHQHGRLYSADTLVQRITGEKLNPDYFGRYLKERYEDVYGVNIPMS